MSRDQEKTALSETAKAFVTPIVGGLVGGAVAYGLPTSVEKIREIRVRRNRDKYIGEMQKVFPDLKGIDKKDLHVAYNSLSMHTPHVLRDPLLGGQTLRSMANYRQADVNALNEISKLRGTTMADQALMNASNVVSQGVTEGFKGYQAQRVADQEQAYRAAQDTKKWDDADRKYELSKEQHDYKKDMDREGTGYQRAQQKYKVEQDLKGTGYQRAQQKYKVEQDLKGTGYQQEQQRYKAEQDLKGTGYQQEQQRYKAEQDLKGTGYQRTSATQAHAKDKAQFDQRERGQAYNAARAAIQDQQWEVSQGTQDSMRAMKEHDWMVNQIEHVEAKDQHGNVLYDAASNMPAYNIQGLTPWEARERIDTHEPFVAGSLLSPQMKRSPIPTTPAHVPAKYPDQVKRKIVAKRGVIKTSSYEGELYDIVARIRDRRL
jgi:hypothetical protein